MSQKRYEYNSKDKVMVKKDTAFRIVFLFLFLAIFFWQFILIVTQRDNLDPVKITISFLVMFTSAMFVLLGMIYIAKNLKILNRIKLRGRAIFNVTVISTGKKNSFLNIYKIVCEIIAFVMLVVLTCGLTYSVLELIYYSTISFYMPLVAIMSLTGFHTVYHINNEISIIKNVREYNSVL